MTTDKDTSSPPDIQIEENVVASRDACKAVQDEYERAVSAMASAMLAFHSAWVTEYSIRFRLKEQCLSIVHLWPAPPDWLGKTPFERTSSLAEWFRDLERQRRISRDSCPEAYRRWPKRIDRKSTAISRSTS